MPILRYSSPKHHGFTLVELVTVMVLISILAITVFSRISSTSGYAEFTYQARLISALRNMQTRAMHDNRSDYCFQVNFDATTAAFGPPTLSYTSGDAADTCDANIDHNNSDYLTTSATEMNDASVSLITDNGGNTFSFIRFNKTLGLPSTESSDCTDVCKITFTGESTASVCIESQGYIHACD